MPQIIIHNTEKLKDEQKETLIKALSGVIPTIPGLGLTEANLSYTLLECPFNPPGTPLKINIVGLFVRPERTAVVKQELYEKVGRVCKEVIPGRKVEVWPIEHDPKNGFYSA